MDNLQKQALQVAKEIVVKFIEAGRISPGNFGEHFRQIYQDVLETIGGDPSASAGEPDGEN